jgi:hypothetical protein
MPKPSRLWLLIPPLLFFIKDTIATLAILATEPGITDKAKFYYALALMPGSLIVEDASPATIVNVLFGALVGLVLFVCLRFVRRGNALS